MCGIDRCSTPKRASLQADESLHKLFAAPGRLGGHKKLPELDVCDVAATGPSGRGDSAVTYPVDGGSVEKKPVRVKHVIPSGTPRLAYCVILLQFA